MITPELLNALKVCETRKDAVSLVLEHCWEDWQQDEALDWLEEHRADLDWSQN